MTTSPQEVVGMPTLDAIRQWCQISRASMSDEQLQQVVDAELAQQAAYCRLPRLDGGDQVDPVQYPPAMAQALYRRVGRVAASRGIPLGLIGDPASEQGALRLATFDAEIERVEGAWRAVVFG